LPWFAVFLLVYVVVVGPVNYLILKRRGKRDWAWVSIPALALLFSGVAFGLSRSAQSGVNFQHASVIYAVSEGEVGRVVGTANSPGGTNARLRFPSKDVTVAGAFGRGQVKSQATGSGTEALLHGFPFALEVATGSLNSIEGTLSAELEWDGRGFFGTVTNNTPYHLSQVRVMVGPVEATAGTLGPGETTEVALVPDVTGVGTGQSFQRFAGRQDLQPEVQVRELLVQELTALTGLGSSVITPIVIGFTGDHDPGLSLSGTPLRADGRSLIASPATLTFPQGASGRLPPIVGTIARTGVNSGTTGASRGFSSFAFGPVAPWGLLIGGFEETVLVQKLPDTLDVDRISDVSLRLKVDDFIGQNFPGRQSATPTPTTARYLVEIYNWETRDWIEVEVPVTGQVDFTGDLPDAVVSKEGEIVLRVTPEGMGDSMLSLIGVEVEI
jgi:hypothetical protein